MNLRSKQRWSSAAARRICSLAGETQSVEAAILLICDNLLRGLACPPTDLEAIMPRLNVARHEARDDLAGSGALIRTGDQLTIAYSSQLSQARRRWTIAHELGHALFETTGPNPPRHGRELERLCDMIATELLLPRKYFVPRIRENVCLNGVLRLADVFQTSVSAAAIRCAELCGVSVFETDAGTLRWGYGHIRRQFHLASNASLAEVVSSAANSDCGSQEVDLSLGNQPRWWTAEWRRIGGQRRSIFMLRLSSARQRSE